MRVQPFDPMAWTYVQPANVPPVTGATDDHGAFHAFMRGQRIEGCH